MRLTRLGLEHIAAKETKKGGIIINCSTILGFTGWPKTPKPVYCYPESTIETTMDLAKQFPTEKTSLRLVVLCPANSTYESIGLPDDPNKIDLLQRFGSCKLICSPDPMKDRSRMGKALAHVTARAENGSCWFIEKPYTLRETPRLVRISRDDKDVESFNKQVAPCPVNYNVYKKNVSK